MNTRYLGLTTGSQNVAEVAEGVSFDGVTDYLSRSSDLVGNVDSKQFTFSCWFYFNGSNIQLLDGDVNRGIDINIYGGGAIRILAMNSAGTVILNTSSVSTGDIKANTWTHILASCNLETLTFQLYINNNISNQSIQTITNDTINNTGRGSHILCRTLEGSNYLKGRLSNVFLDYTYRDLSIEANRRLFITADGKPTPTATLKALNPILYLPLKDAATAHINEGTGGNFVQNGTLDTSSRGANQDNCVASYFDGVADYMSKTSLTGAVDGSAFIVSFHADIKVAKNWNQVFSSSSSSGSSTNAIHFSFNASNQLVIQVKNIADTFIVDATVSYPLCIVGKNVSIQISIDTTDTAKRYVIINNQIATVTWSTYLNGTIDFTSTYLAIGRLSYSAANYMSGNIGELYFDTKYIDLATNNPFWDTTENKPKPVRQVLRETGVTPLIAMPLDASNAGKNYGSGGDFTANSAPYVGARGASEFWVRSMKGDGTSGHLKSTSMNGLSSSKTFSFVGCGYSDLNTSQDTLLSIQFAGGTANNFRLIGGDGNLTVIGANSAGTIILNDVFSGALPVTTWNTIFVSVDLNLGVLQVYTNGVLRANTSPTLINDFINFTNANAIYVGAEESSSTVRQWWQGNLASMYFTTDYIDFSREVNRNKFVDQLGYPKDLKAQIDAGVIPKPLFYLPFDDVSNLGKDASGNGNHFSVVGTVTSGADFSL